MGHWTPKGGWRTFRIGHPPNVAWIAKKIWNMNGDIQDWTASEHGLDSEGGAKARFVEQGVTKGHWHKDLDKALTKVKELMEKIDGLAANLGTSESVEL